jgi:3-oxoacyl-[acyl-carrier-protein] synthase II
MDIFIKGVGNISPQNTIKNTLHDVEIIQHHTAYLKSIEPEYKGFINPVSLRRMSRIIKMGVTAAQVSLKEANISNPDAIITATGLGCIEDTENFLNSIISNEEKLLNPTPFILSTHNTMAAQIALLLKCNNYNITHSHRGNSFESALMDAMLLMKEKEANNVLLGAADEITPNLFKITKRLNLWKKEPVNHLKLAEYKTKGSIAGEGAAFFALTNESSTNNYACINAIDSFYKPETNDCISKRISSFLLNNKLKTDDIDLVIMGNNGDINTDDVYHYLINELFEKNTAAYYKHLSGEYQTSSSFAMWLAAVILKNQEIPQIVKLNDQPHKKINNVLIYNHYYKINHSLILLSTC